MCVSGPPKLVVLLIIYIIHVRLCRHTRLNFHKYFLLDFPFFPFAVCAFHGSVAFSYIVFICSPHQRQMRLGLTFDL